MIKGSKLSGFGACSTNLGLLAIKGKITDYSFAQPNELASRKLGSAPVFPVLSSAEAHLPLRGPQAGVTDI